jgi:pimeloyl-ACP methyl ester carboxylesterase
MHSAFEQFAAFARDAKDNQALIAQGKLQIPVLGIGGEKTYGARVPEELRSVADDLSRSVIANSGHFLMEEQPEAVIGTIRSFLDRPI